jgi:murein DD-endopeptidase MepM/ murein hydrolase activator NlpD
MSTNLWHRMPLPTADAPGSESESARRRRPSRTTRHALVALLAALVVGAVGVPSLSPAPSASAEMSDDAAQQAAREIQAARERANAAADAFLQAQSDLEVLQDDAAELEKEASVLRERVEKLQRDVASLAVARFATSGSKGIPLLTGLQAPKDQIQAEVYGNVVTNAGNSSIDEFELARKELAAKQQELREREDDIENQQKVFAQLQDEADAEVKRLREIEEKRLTDEAVVRALAAQQEAALAKLADADLRNAEAAARALPNPGVLAAVAAAAADESANTVPGSGDAGGGDGDLPTPGVPVVTVAPSAGASGGTSGGRTGTGGAGSVPMGVLNGEVYVDSIICPMPGSAYGDSWGAPRSGGRRHEGVDMLAPTGTPIYAVVSGNVRFSQNRLGGNAVSLVGDNGNRYYYAHLSRYEGASRRVTQGEVIGYNGDTGNATGVPHLHFEVHPGGGLAVNPTPSVRAAGC